MTDEEIEDFIGSHYWKFAKTMPHSPHWYTLRERARSNEEFDRMVLEIRNRGKVIFYKGRPYTCLTVGDYYYWTMGAPVNETILINRAKVEK